VRSKRLGDFSDAFVMSGCGDEDEDGDEGEGEDEGEYEDEDDIAEEEMEVVMRALVEELRKEAAEQVAVGL
jgi:hypothetical protein